MKRGWISRSVTSVGAVVGTVLALTQAAGAEICPSGADQLQCAVRALESYGFYDGPMSATITAGSETATFSGSGFVDFVTKFYTLYPDTTILNGQPHPGGTSPTQKFTAQYFPNLFGQNLPADLALHPALFTTYPLLNTLPITASATLDGVTISLSAAANSNTVVVDVPKAGIHQSFASTSRYQSLQDLHNYISDNGNELLNSLHNAVAANSAVDPVIGSPQSFVQQLASTTYEFGTAIGEASPAQAKSQAGVGTHLDPAFSMSMEPQYFAADGVDGIAIHVPLDYTWFLSDPRYAITLDVPLSYVRQNSSDAISGAIGLGIRIPLTDHWYVTPQAHFGAVVSLDRGPFGVGNYGSVVYTLGVRSKYNFFVFDDTIKFSIINSFGYYKSLDVKLKQYTLDPKISTRIYTNGLSAETASDFTLFGAPTAWTAYAQDNRISGTRSLITGWEEFGVSLGTTGRMTKQSWERLQIGLSVALGDSNYRAVQLNVVTQF